MVQTEGTLIYQKLAVLLCLRFSCLYLTIIFHVSICDESNELSFSIYHEKEREREGNSIEDSGRVYRNRVNRILAKQWRFELFVSYVPTKR